MLSNKEDVPRPLSHLPETKLLFWEEAPGLAGSFRAVKHKLCPRGQGQLPKWKGVWTVSDHQRTRTNGTDCCWCWDCGTKGCIAHEARGAHWWHTRNCGEDWRQEACGKPDTAPGRAEATQVLVPLLLPYQDLLSAPWKVRCWVP